jgi:hypothetical protein
MTSRTDTTTNHTIEEGTMRRITTVAAALTFMAARAVMPAPAAAADGGEVFLASAVEHADHTVTLPLHAGRAGGTAFWYVVLDASTSSWASHFGVNRSNKLENAGAAAQPGRFVDGVLVVDATVDFTPVRSVDAGRPGSVGDDGYSPLVRLPDGAVIDAPHVMNATGRHDKVVSVQAGTVRLRETEGRSRGEVVHYVSTDASKAGPAALEGATLAPRLDRAPAPGQDGTDSSRASLAAFVNGRTGANDPERQGIASALADGLDPLNVLAWLPNQGRYSPLWDVHLTEWTAAAKAAGLDTRQARFADVEDLAEDGLVTGPGGSSFGPSDVVVVCPIISQE